MRRQMGRIPQTKGTKCADIVDNFACYLLQICVHELKVPIYFRSNALNGIRGLVCMQKEGNVDLNRIRGHLFLDVHEYKLPLAVELIREGKIQSETLLRDREMMQHSILPSDTP